MRSLLGRIATALTIASLVGCGLGISGEGSSRDDASSGSATSGSGVSSGVSSGGASGATSTGSSTAGASSSGGSSGASAGASSGTAGDGAAMPPPASDASTGSKDAASDVDAEPICPKLNDCCTKIKMLSPTSNTASCFAAAASGNASSCSYYYGVLMSAYLCP
ncbi:MAG: hypothetical protein ACREJ3_19140 [Polyangiaceae bacterium]